MTVIYIILGVLAYIAIGSLLAYWLAKDEVMQASNDDAPPALVGAAWPMFLVLGVLYVAAYPMVWAARKGGGSK